MAVDQSDYRGADDPGGGALAGVVLAASLMVLIGVFQFLAGLVAIVEDEFYVITPNYLYDVDITGWGWIHLIIGIVVFLGGLALFARRPWAGYLGIALAIISAIANFFFIPYYPFWAILIIAIDVFVIWAITRPGALIR